MTAICCKMNVPICVFRIEALLKEKELMEFKDRPLEEVLDVGSNRHDKVCKLQHNLQSGPTANQLIRKIC